MKLPFRLSFVLLAGLIALPLSASAATPQYYRGFAVSASQPAGDMGNVILDSITPNVGKKIRISANFREMLADLGGIENLYAPRDPQNKNVVYLGTNHFIREEGGQTGVFTIWSYNLSSGTGKRVTSMRYTPSDAPEGYGIIGNEGTNLIVLKNIDGPYCVQQLANTATTHAAFQSLNLRNPSAGFRTYTPSTSMRKTFEQLPRCGSATGTDPLDHTNNLTAADITLNTYPSTIFHFPSIPLTASVDPTKFPAGATLLIGEQTASIANGKTLQTCTVATCTATVSPSVNTHNYIAIVRDQTGKTLAWKSWPTITVTNEPPPQI